MRKRNGSNGAGTCDFSQINKVNTAQLKEYLNQQTSWQIRGSNLKGSARQRPGVSNRRANRLSLELTQQLTFCIQLLLVFLFQCQIVCRLRNQDSIYMLYDIEIKSGMCFLIYILTRCTYYLQLERMLIGSGNSRVKGQSL